MADALGHASPGPTPKPPPPEEPVPDPVAEADQYAVIYPQRAPRSCRSRAISVPPELVDAIVTGTGPALRALLVSPTGTRGIDEISAAEPHSRSEQRVGVS